MARIRKHLTYSNVMVTLLAFVVLGGTAWAIAKNSVGTKQLQKNAVHTSDIDNGAVTAEKIADGVIGGNATVRTTTQTVPLTCTETQVVPGAYFLSCNGQATVIAPCEAGEHATGGGYATPPANTSPPTSGATVNTSRPEPVSGTPTGWAARVTAFGSNSGNSPGLAHPPDPEVSIYAICGT